MAGPVPERPEIVFLDVETTIPARTGRKFALLEFGAIVVCPHKLVELTSYSSLIRPPELSLISDSSVNCNGITREDVSAAPMFQDVADRIYHLLQGRVWAGHNILAFDCLRIKEAFEEIGREPPVAKGFIDSLHLLRQKFGPRAGNMKMASLACYFGLGSQKHRSIDDIRMNLEVLKSCATVLFLESNFTDVLQVDDYFTPKKSETPNSSNSRSSRKKKSSVQVPSEERAQLIMREERSCLAKEVKNNLCAHNLAGSIPSVRSCSREISVDGETSEGREKLLGQETLCLDTKVKNDPYDVHSLAGAIPRTKHESEDSLISRSENKEDDLGEANSKENMKVWSREESPLANQFVQEISNISVDPISKNSDICERVLFTSPEPDILRAESFGSPQSCPNALPDLEDKSNQEDQEVTPSEIFLEPTEISITSLKTTFISRWRGQKMMILHKDVSLKMHCREMKIRFNISRKYFNPAKSPRLSFVVEPSSESCHLMNAFDILAKESFLKSSSESLWRPLLPTEDGFAKAGPAVRIHIGTTGIGETAQYLTKINRKDSTGRIEEMTFEKVDIGKLDELIVPGRLIDAACSFDIFDYQGSAGIRVIAKILTVRC